MVVMHAIMAVDSADTRSILGDLLVRVDHIGVCVANIDSAAKPWIELIGTPVVEHEHVSAQRVDVGWLTLPGAETRIELLASTGNPGVDRFLAKRGNAMHHIALSVTDIREAVARIEAAGLALIDREPRPGAGGHLVAFLHPKAMAGILVELVQTTTSHRADDADDADTEDSSATP